MFGETEKQGRPRTIAQGSDTEGLGVRTSVLILSQQVILSEGKFRKSFYCENSELAGVKQLDTFQPYIGGKLGEKQVMISSGFCMYLISSLHCVQCIHLKTSCHSSARPTI